MATHSIIQKPQLEGAHRLDAEYYQPEYLNLISKIKSQKSKLWRDIDGKFITGPFGSEFNVENYISDGKFRYVRGKDVKEFFLSDNDNVYIPEKDFKRLSKYSLQEGDILVSVVGTLGNVAIVDDLILPAIFSCKSTVFRTKAINPYYFLAYLNSNYGKKLLERSVRGAVQTGLNIDDLRDLLIFIPPLKDQEKIGEIIVKSKSELENSKSLYFQAENLLLQELGLKDFEAESSLFSVVKLSEVKSVNRIDAEYFQLKYEKVLAKIRRHNAKSIGEISELVGHATQSPYDEIVGDVAVLAQKHMKRNLIIDTSSFDNYTTENLIKKSDKKFILKKGDVLISSAGEPGLTCVWAEEDRVIPGSFVTIVRFTDEIEPFYVGVFLNTIAGRLQFERDYTGSVQQYVYPVKIKEIIIPILPKPTQQKIADLVQKSHESRKKAKELLEEAKNRVEELVETKK